MEEEFFYELKLPKDRVAVLIGKEGKVKKEIEKAGSVKIDVDSGEGIAKISGDDAINIYSTREIIRAIARGFNPEVATLLFKQDYALEILDISDYGKSKEDIVRLKGRVIGEGGRTRRKIEETAECHISVYGKTVGIIARVEMLPVARKTIESLLSGARHATVYKWLEAKAKELKRRVFEYTEE